MGLLLIGQRFDRKITQDTNKPGVKNKGVDILCTPMTNANSAIAHLQKVMPGQSDAWYSRIADEITAGRMPLPKIDNAEVPTIATKTERPAASPRPSAHIPNTVGDAMRQAKQRITRPAQSANATTKWKLERLVHSDKKAAERLAAQVAFANPNQSEQWCWEKAIYDLERDRV